MYGRRPYSLLLIFGGEMKKTSYKVAMGGVVSALAVFCMFLTGVFPLLSLTLPCMAGLLMVVIVIEVGTGWAYVTYAGVALLSLLVTPEKDIAILFVMFFGYYPILKGTIERIKSHALQWAVKFLVFNAAIISAFMLITYAFGMTQMLDEFNDYGRYGILIVWVAAQGVFWLCDSAMTVLIDYYLKKFRPTFLRKMR